MIDLGLAGALVGGILTLLSPCSVMLLPAFFAYAFTSPSRLIARTGVFYLGLITTLVPIGVLAGTVGAFVSTNRTMLVTVALFSPVAVATAAMVIQGSRAARTGARQWVWSQTKNPSQPACSASTASSTTSLGSARASKSGSQIPKLILDGVVIRRRLPQRPAEIRLRERGRLATVTS